MGDRPEVASEDMVAALTGGPPPLPPQLLPEQQAIAAAGTWGQLGSVLLLRRDEDGELVNDTYLLSRDERGRWRSADTSAGSGVPEWVLHRPESAFEPWHGEHLWVLTGQLAVVRDHGWCGDVTVMVSRAVTAVEFVHDQKQLCLPVPASGLVSVAHPVRNWRDEVLVRALEPHGSLLGSELYPFLTDSDHGWPDPSLWTGHWSQE